MQNIAFIIYFYWA